MVRPGAIFPIAFAAVAVVLSFLSLFAGHKKGFLEDYHIVTLNTSRIGQNLLNESSSASSHLPSFLSGFLHNITSSISNDINEAVESLAQKLGVEDFYSYHMLDYCYGDYSPQPVPNNTVSSKDIHKVVNNCSESTAMYSFNATAVVQDSLDRANVNINVNDLDWPKQITDALNALRVASKAVFVLYCIGIGLAIVSFVTSLMGLISSSRFTAFVNILTAILAFFAIGIASAIVTVIMVKGSHAVNKYGKVIGIEAHRGNKYLALTWAATGAMFLSAVLWSIECCVGSRRRAPRTYGEKP